MASRAEKVQTRPRTAKLRIKVAASGKTAAITFPCDTLAEIASRMDPGPQRDQIEAAVAMAGETLSARRCEERLAAPLSIESLKTFGWMMTGEHSTTAYGAIREGDFRYVELALGAGWEYGAPGAFDRDGAESIILRGATQAGVMSEKHAAYRLLEPTMDRMAAIADAEWLTREWRTALPKRCAKPAHMSAEDNPVEGLLPYGKAWFKHYEKIDLQALPEGAAFSTGRKLAFEAPPHMMRGEVVSEGDMDVNVVVYPFEAVLRHRAVTDVHEVAVTDGTAWDIGRHPYDQKLDRNGDGLEPLSGPYDCVLGTAWAVTHNHGHYRRIGFRTALPFATREAAMTFAHRLEREIRKAVPETVDVPPMMAVPVFDERSLG